MMARVDGDCSLGAAPLQRCFTDPAVRALCRVARRATDCTADEAAIFAPAVMQMHVT